MPAVPRCSPLFSAVLTIMFTTACFQDPGSSDTGETGEPPEALVTCWCAIVDDAEVDPVMGPPEPIVDPENNDGSPVGCTPVADGELHQDLLDASTNDVLVVANNDDAAWVTVRDEAFTAAESYCDSLADIQGGAGSTNDCNSILVDGTSPIQYIGSRMCTASAGLESTPDKWSDYYVLSNVIYLNTTSGTREVDYDFFKDVVRNPWWLLDDSTRIAPNSSSDLEFINVQSGDIAHALGIANHDVPLTLNDYDVTSLTDMIVAYAALWGETEFELVVNRPGVGSITLSYELVQ